MYLNKTVLDILNLQLQRGLHGYHTCQPRIWCGPSSLANLDEHFQTLRRNLFV